MRTAIVACVMALSAEATAGDPRPPAADAKLAGNVLVWADARWYASSDDKAPSAQLTEFGKEARAYKLGFVLPAKVIAMSGAFVQVEPLATTSDCSWWRVTSEPPVPKLRLFVKRADLAPLLTKRYVNRAKDGTSLAVEPGVPVVPTNGSQYVVSINGDNVIASIPDTSIGHSYRPGRAFKRTKRNMRFTLSNLAIGRLIDENFTVNARETFATTVVTRGDEVLFPLAAPCITAVFQTDKTAVMKDTPTWDDPKPPVPTRKNLTACTDVVLGYTRVDEVVPEYGMNEAAQRTLKLCPPGGASR